MRVSTTSLALPCTYSVVIYLFPFVWHEHRLAKSVPVFRWCMYFSPPEHKARICISVVIMTENNQQGLKAMIRLKRLCWSLDDLFSVCERHPFVVALVCRCGIKIVIRGGAGETIPSNIPLFNSIFFFLDLFFFVFLARLSSRSLFI